LTFVAGGSIIFLESEGTIMKVTAEMKMTVQLELTEKEEKAIKRATECIEILCSLFEQEGDLISPTTGEVIQTFELRRMLGILNGIEENRCWEFEQRGV
jgi:hypothetical protein